MKYMRIILEMAKEIADLRRECDLEWGEYDEKNYNVKKIAKEYMKEFKDKGGGNHGR